MPKRRSLPRLIGALNMLDCLPTCECHPLCALCMLIWMHIDHTTAPARVLHLHGSWWRVGPTRPRTILLVVVQQPSQLTRHIICIIHGLTSTVTIACADIASCSLPRSARNCRTYALFFLSSATPNPLCDVYRCPRWVFTCAPGAGEFGLGCGGISSKRRCGAARPGRRTNMMIMMMLRSVYILWWVYTGVPALRPLSNGVTWVKQALKGLQHRTLTGECRGAGGPSGHLGCQKLSISHQSVRYRLAERVKGKPIGYLCRTRAAMTEGRPSLSTAPPPLTARMPAFSATVNQT
ncbi:hypothetical protein BC834DRAFT_395955 [Gloeopeniophorella convolvens]|nr:hypothetical protein BC834DRAFT_395955 [Gloeopeniophorella convolvens]